MSQYAAAPTARQESDLTVGLRGCSQQAALDHLFAVVDPRVAATRRSSVANGDSTFPDWGALFTQVRTPHPAKV